MAILRASKLIFCEPYLFFFFHSFRCVFIFFLSSGHPWYTNRLLTFLVYFLNVGPNFFKILNWLQPIMTDMNLCLQILILIFFFKVAAYSIYLFSISNYVYTSMTCHKWKGWRESRSHQIDIKGCWTSFGN